MHFRENIIIYNDIIAFTLYKFKIDNRIANISNL